MRFRFGLLGAVVAALGASLMAAPEAHAEWLRAETDHFIVYGDTSEASLRRYARKVERFDALLRTYYPIETEYVVPKLEIFMADGRRDMNRVSPGIGEGVAGYYAPNSGRIYSVVDTRSGMGDVVVFHEYAHHFMFQMRSNAYPSWFVEGFAEYYSTADVDGERIQFGRHNAGRMNSLTDGANSWAPMPDVLKWRLTASGRYPGHLYYAQAWAMTHYFMSTPERTRMLGSYLNSVVGGQDSVVAMQAATGKTAEELQKDVWRYASGPITVLTPQITLPDPTVTITPLTRAEADAIWLDIRLDTTPIVEPPADEDGRTRKSESQKAREARETAEHRAELIRSALALAGTHNGDKAGLLLAARAHRLSARPDLALEVLAPALNDSQTDADILRVAAMAMLDQAGAASDPDAVQTLRAKASGYLARAMDNDPTDFRVYLGLNDTRRGQTRYPTDNDISTLEVAYALAPQSFETRVRLGEAYMARSLNVEAVQVLTPVSNSPHRGAYTRRARAMIAQAQAALGQAPTNFDESSTQADTSERPAEPE
ncbi:DUF1570 domain-containing protein [Brevundimonas sp. NPDC090276]|uniref:DUF1570 domain-containing protein n=1 Tax=Brevundimonas sp. NPDC090276 TaxID=3363956 RepID=UPI00383A756B